METQNTQQSPVEVQKTKIEEILANSIKVGNFCSDENEYETSEEIKRKDIYKISLDSIHEFVQFLPFLPEGFGFTGGVARSALLGILGEKIPKIRDYDVEGIEDISDENNPSERDAEIVAEQYLQDDYIRRASINQNLEEYFSTRDFVINEVFLLGNDLYYSKGALLDASNKIIRPTDYEKYRGNKPKMLLRALLFQVELIKMYGKGETQEIESYNMQIQDYPPFYLAKSIEKASQKGVVIEFYKKLFDTVDISEEIVPEGRTLSGLRKLAGLAKHWMLMRNDKRELEYGDDFFDQTYSQELEEEDNQEFDEWYQKSLSRTVHFSKIRPQDLEA